MLPLTSGLCVVTLCRTHKSYGQYQKQSWRLQWPEEAEDVRYLTVTQAHASFQLPFPYFCVTATTPHFTYSNGFVTRSVKMVWRIKYKSTFKKDCKQNFCDL